MYSSKEVKIKKSHECFSCLRIFDVNSKMIKWAGLNIDGDFCYGYTCLTCQKIMDKQPSDEEGYPEGYVKELLQEDQSPECYLEPIMIAFKAEFKKSNLTRLQKTYC